MGRGHPNADGGRAWLILTVAYLGIIVASISLYLNGIIYIELLHKYREGETKTSLVGAVSSGIFCCCAPLGGIINNRFSCRASILIGGVLATLGFALSAFVPSLDWMIVTAGCLTGLGGSIFSSGLACAIGFNFDKHRDIVLSIAYLTPGVAMFASSPLGLYLIKNYGLSNTFLIVACMNAQICVFGAICKPSVIEKEVHAKKKDERASEIVSMSNTYLDLSLLKNIPYLCFLSSTTTWNFALTVAIIHLPNYVAVLGGSDSDINYIMASFSIANIVGRLAGSFAVSKFRNKSIYVHVSVLAITGVMSSLFPLYSKLKGGVYIFGIQLGIFCGCPNTMMTPLSLGYVGVAKLSESYSLAFVFCGIGVSTGPVLIGYLYSVSGSYEYSFLVAGCVLIVGSLFGVCSQCTKRKYDAADANARVVEGKTIKYFNENIRELGVHATLI